VPNAATTTHGISNGRAKRKGKEKEKPTVIAEALSNTVTPRSKSKVLGGDISVEQPEEEEQGITRCVCGSTGE
jgi:hypothetical protein